MSKEIVRPYLVRLGIVFAISLAFVIVFNEISFRLQKEQADRPPETIRLVIPSGTAARVEAGEEIPDIPDELIFVVGDTLEVVNQDNVNHQLGPILVPPGSSGKLHLEKVDKLAYSCSFQTSRYLGLDIRQPTTMGTRILGISIATPTLTALIFIYSIAASPINTDSGDKKKTAAEDSL